MYEEWTVLTYRDYDFEDNGRTVKGRTLHAYRPSNENGWPGVEYAKLSVPCGSQAYNMTPELGKNYQLVFDRRGKVVQMTAV